MNIERIITLIATLFGLVAGIYALVNILAFKEDEWEREMEIRSDILADQVIDSGGSCYYWSEEEKIRDLEPHEEGLLNHFCRRTERKTGLSERISDKLLSVKK